MNIEEMVNELFDVFDVNGDGVISRGEFIALAESLLHDKGVRFSSNIFKQFQEFPGFHEKSRFFKGFSDHSFLERLPNVHQAPWNAPLAQSWLLCSLYQNDSVPLGDECSDSYQGEPRIFPGLVHGVSNFLEEIWLQALRLLNVGLRVEQPINCAERRKQ